MIEGLQGTTESAIFPDSDDYCPPTITTKQSEHMRYSSPTSQHVHSYSSKQSYLSQSQNIHSSSSKQSHPFTSQHIHASSSKQSHPSTSQHIHSSSSKQFHPSTSQHIDTSSHINKFSHPKHTLITLRPYQRTPPTTSITGTIVTNTTSTAVPSRTGMTVTNTSTQSSPSITTPRTTLRAQKKRNVLHLHGEDIVQLQKEEVKIAKEKNSILTDILKEFRMHRAATERMATAIENQENILREMSRDVKNLLNK